MTSRPALRGAAHRLFRSLPRGVRRRLVRLLTPNYTVGAVVLVRDQDGALLLLRQPPGHGWSLPGGLLNHREPAARGAARELAEEAGIEVDPDTLAPASPNARINAVAQQVDVVFKTTVDSRSNEVHIDPVEVLEAGWHPLDRLPPLTVATAQLLALYDIGPYARYADDGAPRSAPDRPATPDQPAIPDQPATPDQPVAADDPATGAP